jgi:hypothetical protein
LIWILSIIVMVLVGDAVILVVPGAMDAGLYSVLFWATLALALGLAFSGCLRRNRSLIARGTGQAVVH